MSQEDYLSLGLDQPAPTQVNGRSNHDILNSLNVPQDRIYHPCPEAYPDRSLPTGSIFPHRDWAESKLYPGTIRDLFVYIPTQYTQGSESCRLLIFNDGAGYLSRRGSVRAGLVLDSLHANDNLPPTVAIFVNPGRPIGTDAGLTADYDEAAIQRSIEYDTISDRYSKFLLQELLPFVEKEHHLQISSDPEDRAVLGISSGGICAFSCAWFAPDSFSRVVSHCGSFTNIRGGHNYPYLIRSTPRKNIRVFLQSGTNDGATIFGDWPTANQSMAKALDYAGYDYRFEFGQGGHTLRHAGALFADTLRWLWRD
ncbi:MAG: alpha/beta hydrolase-fold protein [Pseudomonadota bacterium]